MHMSHSIRIILDEIGYNALYVMCVLCAHQIIISILQLTTRYKINSN